MKTDKKNKVLYDHQIFSQEVGGIARYFNSMINAIEKSSLCDYTLSVFVNKNLYFDKAGIIRLKFRNNSLVSKIINKRPFRFSLKWLNETYTLYNLRNQRYNLIHVTNDDVSYLTKRKINIPIVLTVHDLIPELFPNYFPDILIRLKKRKEAISIADYYIAISESTRKDLIEFYNINPERISVIHHGCPLLLESNNEFVNKIPNQKKYLLYVGDRNAKYKNFIELVEKMKCFLDDNHDFVLVCVGSSFSKNEKIIIKNLKLESKLIAFRASDDELFSIYKNAKCFIYPSLYEGFGLPLLEAMSAECPILCSSTSCFLEIAGSGALYFNPKTFEDFYENLDLILKDKKTIAELNRSQSERLKSFSWEQTAEKTVDVYKKAIENFVI